MNWRAGFLLRAVLRGGILNAFNDKPARIRRVLCSMVDLDYTDVRFNRD